MLHKKSIVRPSADVTRHAILVAARKIFLEKGFSGTSMSSISKEAGVTQSLIHHHFSSKEELWATVKRSIAQEFSDTKSTEKEKKPTDFRGFLEFIIRQRCAFYEYSPDIARLANWQRVEKVKDAIAGNSSKSPQTWVEDLKRFQEEGKIRRDISCEMMITLIGYAVAAPFLDNPEAFKDNFQKKETYIKFVLDCFYRGMGT